MSVSSRLAVALRAGKPDTSSTSAHTHTHTHTPTHTHGAAPATRQTLTRSKSIALGSPVQPSTQSTSCPTLWCPLITRQAKCAFRTNHHRHTTTARIWIQSQTLRIHATKNRQSKNYTASSALRCLCWFVCTGFACTHVLARAHDTTCTYMQVLQRRTDMSALM